MVFLLTFIFLLQRPVVIPDSELVSPAMKWDLQYLSANMGNGDCNVYESKSNVFKYFDESKRQDFPDFEPPMERLEMKFAEFVEKLKAGKDCKKRLDHQIILYITLKPGITKFSYNFVMSFPLDLIRYLGLVLSIH